MNNELEIIKNSIIEQDNTTATSNSTTLTIGMILDGTYEIKKEIARGGMGIVYEAYHKFFNKKVAIKIILSDTIDSLQLKRFQKEIEACAKLSHPNIIHIYHAGIYENKPYIVMEYIDGVNICQYVAQHDPNYGKPKLYNAGLGIKRDWKLCVRLIYKVALALEYIHKQKMLHRDIKPSNIIVRSDGTPIIIDFGIVKFQSKKITSLTERGEILGTLQYMSIEQARGKNGEIDARSDIYSLGLVLYELLTGQMAYSEENVIDLCYDILLYFPPLPREINPQIPEALEKITMHAIEKQKENRYATAKEFADALKKYFYDENAKETRKHNDDKKQVRLQRNKNRIVACCIALVLVIMATFAIITSNFSPSIPEDPIATYQKAEKLYKERKYQEAFILMEQSANYGHIPAVYLLGEMYYYGRGVERNYKKAFVLFQKVNNTNGFYPAKYLLGYMYYGGLGVNKDYKQAFDLFQKVVTLHGFYPAKYLLGYMYYEGLGVEQDYQKAFTFFSKVASYNNFKTFIEAQYLLGKMYYYGQGVEKDEQKAIEWLEKVASKGNIKAQELLNEIKQLQKENLLQENFEEK